ncbi:hypothetical protein [Phaeocystidibacter luteus]|uniref:Uncharacterized protein n=1 Tax=Phaeocystidibacter luteus TaxID=911197 RepID=A0A6N6RM04_9FLAO|nr:hypothetical protein [Phaeocystidibacter luteus]KAB2814617.1 hypothetical protein F8C67_02425 [Phaeocystidibacter luteus]
MKRSYRILLLLTLSGTGELILGACMRFLEMAGANILMVAGLISQVSALGYAGYLSLQRRTLKAEV